MKFVVLPTFLFAMVSAIVALCLWWAGVTFGRGEYLTVSVLLVAALSVLCFPVALVLVLLGGVRPRADCGDEATTVRPDRLVYGLNKWGSFGGYLAAVTFAIFRPLGMIDIPLPPGNGRALLIAIYGLAIFGIFELWRTFRPGGVSFVRLTPKDLAMSQASSSMKGGWDDVVAITDRKLGKKPPYRAMAFVEFGDGRVRSQILDDYTPGGEAMRRWVSYYWMYPDHRDELTDGRAVERLERLRRDSVR